MNVGFWNIQRATSERNQSASDRRDVMLQLIGEMADTCDIIFLAEATSSASTQGALAELTRATGGMRAQFVRSADRNGNTSQCSFVILSRPGFNIHDMEIDNRRPMVAVRANEPVWLGACHILSGGSENSVEEIDGVLQVVGAMCQQDNTAGLVIGDMNFRFADAERVQLDAWAPIRSLTSGNNPVPIERTHRNGMILDYAWRTVNKQGYRPCRCQPLAARQVAYTRWDTIDHAPIAVKITMLG